MNIRGSMAVSLDGFVADAEGGVGWLDAYHDGEAEQTAFLDEIDTIIVGRTTYEQVLGFGVGWPYAGKRVYVVTSASPLTPHENTVIWRDGLAPLIRHVRRTATRDVWILGGPTLQADVLACDALDQLDLAVIPVLLGAGIALFPPQSRGTRRLTLVGSRAASRGVAHLRYRFEPVSESA